MSPVSTLRSDHSVQLKHPNGSSERLHISHPLVMHGAGFLLPAPTWPFMRTNPHRPTYKTNTPTWPLNRQLYATYSSTIVRTEVRDKDKDWAALVAIERVTERGWEVDCCMHCFGKLLITNSEPCFVNLWYFLVSWAKRCGLTRASLLCILGAFTPVLSCIPALSDYNPITQDAF